MTALLALALACCLLGGVAGHGMMLDPPNRSSVWRYYPEALPNYTDNQVFCGGEPVQNKENGGRCGVCGDNWADPHPQDNENTGLYGQALPVSKNHMLNSYVYQRPINSSSLCVLFDYEAPEREECFFALSFEDGSLNYPIAPGMTDVYNRVKLPDGLTCERCVLRWTYRAGNNWGDCGDGTGALGCGPQEHFRNCADISIV